MEVIFFCGLCPVQLLPLNREKDFWMEDFKDVILVRNQRWNPLFPQVWSGCLKNSQEHEAIDDDSWKNTLHCFEYPHLCYFSHSYFPVFLPYSEYESCQQHFTNRWFNWILWQLQPLYPSVSSVMPFSGKPFSFFFFFLNQVCEEINKNDVNYLGVSWHFTFSNSNRHSPAFMLTKI